MAAMWPFCQIALSSCYIYNGEIYQVQRNVASPWNLCGRPAVVFQTADDQWCPTSLPAVYAEIGWHLPACADITSHQRSYSTSSTVSTEMGDRSRIYIG